LAIVRDEGSLVEELIPPSQTMHQITVELGSDYKVSKQLLAKKLNLLEARGLMDAGLVFVNEKGLLHGYLAQAELEFAVREEGLLKDDDPVDLLKGPLAAFVDRATLTICSKVGPGFTILGEDTS
jgi:chloride channel 3/4/5